MKDLVAKAIEARKKAYAPYSKFKVGAALEAQSGRVYTGCNVENASYGITCCAERTALLKAISEGERSFRRVAIVADSPRPCPPCGICRQAFHEFAKDLEIIMANMNGDVVVHKLSELFPLGFNEKGR